MSTTTEDKSTKTRQSSQRRIDASRANGKKSRGPVTPEGKARSSQNARKPSFLALHICFTAAEAEVFDRILDQYVSRFQPRDQVELDLIEKIVYCEYQIRHTWMERAAALGMQMTIDKDFVNAAWSSPSDIDRSVLALAACIKDGKTIAELDRFSRNLSTQSEKYMKQLLALQKLRIPPPPCAPEIPAVETSDVETSENEPSSEIEHCEPDTTEIQPATANWQPETVLAHPSLVFAPDRVYFPTQSSQSAPRTGLLARTA